MGKYLNPAQVPEIEDAEEATRLIHDVETEALRRVPELENIEATDDTLQVIRRIVLRWKIEGPAAVANQNTGQYGVGFVNDRRIGWRLSLDELTDLRAIAGATVTDPGLPIGSFPAGRIDAIFDPRRPSCT